MSEMINDYQASSGDRSDLFSNLVEANNSEDDDKLSESELMGTMLSIWKSTYRVEDIFKFRQHLHFSFSGPRGEQYS